jgi:2-polyprenyl-3-methyl-5-hydroxy-6-metoxy-1,4-benzoquinol methylase
MPKPMAAERVHDVVLSLLESDKTGRVLDAAAGEGYLTLKLKNMGFEVTPCDINTKNFRIEQAQSTFPVMKLEAGYPLPKVF